MNIDKNTLNMMAKRIYKILNNLPENMDGTILNNILENNEKLKKIIEEIEIVKNDMDPNKKPNSLNKYNSRCLEDLVL